MTDLKKLQAMGAIIPRTFYEKKVAIRRPELRPAGEWADPNIPEATDTFVDDEITIHIRKRSSADFLELVAAPDRDKAHIAVLRCVCNPDGSELFESLDQVKQTEEWLFVPLVMAVNEVNRFGLKNSTPRVSSGAKSRSHSAAVPLRNGKARLAKKKPLHGTPTAPSAAP